MNDKQKNIAHAKADFLANYKASYEESQIKLFAKQQFIEAYNLGYRLPHVFKTLDKVSFKTAERWRKQLEDTGGDIDALAPNYIYKSVPQRKLTEIEKQVLVDFLLRPTRLDIGRCIMHTKYNLQLKGIPTSSHDITFRRFAEDFKEQNKTMWAIMRHGEKYFKDNFLPYIERNSQMLHVGDVFVADGKTTTFMIINPYTGKAQKSNAPHSS